MSDQVSYDHVRTQVHDAIWRLRGADQTRVLIEAERLRALAEQVGDPVGREKALVQVSGFTARVAPPVFDVRTGADSCLVDPPPTS